jgi:hypothetical protein
MMLELKAARSSQKQRESPAGPRPLPPPSPIERRRETRYATYDPVEICILDAGGPRLAGTILDVSRSGVRIETATPIVKGARVEILLPDRAIIFGETRYCRRNSDFYHVGVAIEDVYYAHNVSDKHIHDDQLGLYVVGTGLTTLEAVDIKNHLVGCKACRDRMTEAEAFARPMKKLSKAIV